MRRLFLPRITALSVLALTFALPARADEPAPAAPAPGGDAAAPAPEGAPVAAPQATSEVGKPFDLLTYLTHVRTLVSESMTPPRRSATDHGLYDLWGAILRPRAARMVARTKKLLEPGRWVFDPADGGAAHVKPEAWASTIGELASLYVELGGALQQYQQAQVTITQVRPDGTQPPPTGPVGGSSRSARWRPTSSAARGSATRSAPTRSPRTGTSSVASRPRWRSASSRCSASWSARRRSRTS
jgi:hypothetical protein